MNVDHQIAQFTRALAGPDQPGQAQEALCALVEQTVGAKLVTMSEVDAKNGSARRCYSNMPSVYPINGIKPLEANVWTQTVIQRQEIFVANSITDIARVFPDHELIKSLGCESCMNVPIVVGGAVIGTLNCLDVAGHFTPERIAQAEVFKLPATIVFQLGTNKLKHVA